MTRVLSVTGWSGSGKTTLLVETIAHLVARGSTVAAIKHTHHEVTDEDRGDTARFRAAGAEPVILAGGREAVVFDAHGKQRIEYSSVEELVRRVSTDVVLIEGFKSVPVSWRKIELGDRHRTPADVLELLERIE